MIVSSSFGSCMVDKDALLGLVSQRATIVVAAKNSEDGATVDVNGHVVGRGIQNGVFGTAKDRINLDKVVGNGDFGLFDGGANEFCVRSCCVGPNRVAQLMQQCHFHNTGIGSYGVHRII